MHQKDLMGEIWPPEKVLAYLEGHAYGISVSGDRISLGEGLLLDQESMEVLCRLGLLDRPLVGWHDETKQDQ